MMIIMKTKKTTIAILAFVSVLSYAQTDSTKLKVENFVPSGAPIGKVFFNFHSTFDERTDKSAFELKRAYLGYSYNISENLSAKVLFDAGKSDVAIDLNDSTNVKSSTSLAYTAFVKNAQLSYSNDFVKVSLGMIGNPQYKAAEKLWGRRYIAKNVQDIHKFTVSADLGVSAEFKLHKIITVDVTVRNGEGYKKMESDDIYTSAIGFHLKPVKGLTIRGFYDHAAGENTQYSLMHFVGYKHKIFAVGVEQIVQNNFKYIKDNNHSAVSAFGSIKVYKNVEVFGRYDSYTMKEDESVNENVIITGIQYSPIKNILIALNYQGASFKESSDNTNAVFVNFQYAF